MAAMVVVVEDHVGAEVVVALTETEEADMAIVEAVTVVAVVNLNKALACDHQDGIWLDLVNLKRTFILQVPSQNKGQTYVFCYLSHLCRSLRVMIIDARWCHYNLY